MKTQMTRIGLMALALTTSLTAAGQITDLKSQARQEARAEMKMRESNRSAADEKKSALMDESKASDDKSSKNVLDKDSKDSSEMLRRDRDFDRKTQEKTNGPREMGGVNGGGGSQATVDGQTSLSDRYYKRIGKPLTFQKAFPQELQDYVRSTLQLLESYGIDTNKFYLNMIAASNNLYVFVTPQEFAQVKCDHYLPNLNRPVDKHEQFGCTNDRTTYLIQDYFYSKDANILDLSLRIIHERLWTLNPKIDQRFIADFTTPLGELKAKQDAQVFHNDRAPMTDEEIALFDDLEVAARQLGFSAPENLSSKIIRQGGGRNNGKVSMDADSFIGIGSVVTGDTVIQKSTLVGTNFVSDSTIQNSRISDTSITLATVENSILKQNCHLVGKTKVENSTLNRVTSMMAVILNSSVDHATIGERVILNQSIVKDSQINATSFLAPALTAEIQFAKIQGSTVGSYSIFGLQNQMVSILGSKIDGDLICHGLRCRYSVPTIGAQTAIVNSRLQKGGTIGSNVEITNVIYAASEKEYSKFFMPSIEVMSSSGLRNLNYTYEYESKFWNMGREFQVDTKDQKLDFEGKACASKAYKLKIQSANDLLQHCR